MLTDSQRSRGAKAWLQSQCALLVLCLSISWVQAQTLEVEVSARSITVDDVIQLEIRVEGAFDAIEEPDLSDWSTISNSSSMQTSIIGADIRRERVYRKTLEPRRAGTLQIGAASVLVGGQRVDRSEVISIAVAKPAAVQATSPQQASSLRERAGEAVFIRPTFSDSAPYQGEPFVLAFELFYRANLNLSSQGVDFPELDGFLATSIQQPGKTPQSRRRVGRTVYNVATLKQDVLVPLRAGTIRVAPVEMGVVVGDLFNKRRHRIKSLPFDIEVRPVPEDGRPPEFREGHVGRFEVRARLDQDHAQVGERRMLTIDIEGEGNLDALKPPALPVVADVAVELLKGAESTGITYDASGVKGKVSFTYMLTPNVEGEMALPPVKLAAFDPQTGQFDTAKSQVLSLQVVSGDAAARAAEADHLVDMMPITTDIERSDVPHRNADGAPPIWLALLLPLVAFGGSETALRIHRHRQATQHARQSKRALATALKSVEAAQRHRRDGDSIAFYTAIHSAIDTYLSSRFRVVRAGHTTGTLRTALLQLGLPDRAIGDLVAAIERCESARYAPSGAGIQELEGTAEQAAASLRALDKEAKEVAHDA